MERANVPAMSFPRKRLNSGPEAFPHKFARKNTDRILSALQNPALVDQPPESVRGLVDSSKEVSRAAVSSHPPPLSSRSGRAKTMNGSRTAKSPFSSIPLHKSTPHELRRLTRPLRSLADEIRKQPTGLASRQTVSPHELLNHTMAMSAPSSTAPLFPSSVPSYDSEDEEEDSDEPVRLNKPPMLRKKAWELVRPTLRPPPAKRRPSSMPDASETLDSLLSIESSHSPRLYPSSSAQTPITRPKPAKISYTISQDHTAGDIARRSNLLAAFGKKNAKKMRELQKEHVEKSKQEEAEKAADSPDEYELDLDKRSRSFGGKSGRIILLGDGTEVLTDSNDAEMFEEVE